MVNNEGKSEELSQFQDRNAFNPILPKSEGDFSSEERKMKSGEAKGDQTIPGGDSAVAEKKRIVIAEDHAILRDGLRYLLTGEQYLVVAEAKDGLEALHRVETHKPDLILLDLSMPRMNGISVIKEIKSRFPKTKILALTIHDSEEYILEAFQSGVDGYCLKDSNREELMMAIRSVLMGKPYLSPGISRKVLEGYLEGKKSTESSSSWGTLTQREKEILKLIGEGYKNKEIGDYLYISPETVGKHRANIMRKLDLHNASSLTAFAIEKGLVTR